MNKYLPVIGVIVLLGGVGYFLINSANKDTTMVKNDGDAMMEKSEDAVMEKGEDAMMEESDDKMMADSKYVPYTKSALEKASSGKRVLYFYANWCPTCVPADKNFSANVDKIPDGVTLIRVNYNDPDTDAEEKALANQYKVTYQHTFVQIDAEGNAINRWNGGQISELLANIK